MRTIKIDGSRGQVMVDEGMVARLLDALASRLGERVSECGEDFPVADYFNSDDEVDALLLNRIGGDMYEDITTPIIESVEYDRQSHDRFESDLKSSESIG